MLVTEHTDHAPILARSAIEDGASLVIAWGGDGTVNEVGAQLAFRDVAFGVIPSGSGNGLARELKIPCDAGKAFTVAFKGADKVIDAGEVDGRLFFNLAGVGLDAQVAHRFAATGLVRRGFVRYVEIAVQQVFAFRTEEHDIVADGVRMRTRALVIVIANGRQYGNGALIAPNAQIDDGLLELVVVEGRNPLTTLAQLPLMLAGRVGRLPGVTMRPVREVTVASPAPLIYHVDGEPCVGGSSITVRVKPRALRIRVPLPEAG